MAFFGLRGVEIKRGLLFVFETELELGFRKVEIAQFPLEPEVAQLAQVNGVEQLVAQSQVVDLGLLLEIEVEADFAEKVYFLHVEVDPELEVVQPRLQESAVVDIHFEVLIQLATAPPRKPVFVGLVEVFQVTHSQFGFVYFLESKDATFESPYS